MPREFNYTFEKDGVKIHEKDVVRIKETGETHVEIAYKIAIELAKKRGWKLLSVQDLGHWIHK